jgi:hypothetical protein
MTESLENVLDIMRAESNAHDPRVVPAEDRDRAILAIQTAMREKQLRRTRIRLLSGGSAVLAIAAGALLMVGYSKKSEANGELAHVTQSSGVFADEVAQMGGEVLKEGAVLRAAGPGHSEFQYPSGTKVRLEAGSRITLSSQGKEKVFSVLGGSFDAKVSKLQRGERFIVRTSDTEVEVRGTQFTVSVVPSSEQCGTGTTRVDVTEGVVAVRSRGQSVDVRAGEHWPLECTQAAAREVPGVAFENLPATKSVGKDSGHTAHVPSLKTPSSQPGPSGATSRLGEQNDLFADAMMKKRAGDSHAALEGFERLMRDYPRGPLTESAAAEKMRILGTAQAAKSYLQAYPDGFAKAEAEARLK